MHQGSVALILHAHQPYLRAAGRTYAGEEPLHELIAATVIPTLNALYDLHEQRTNSRVGLAYSPILVEQLGDPVVLKHFAFWLDAWLEQLAANAKRSHASEAQAYQADCLLTWANDIRQSFDQRYGRNLIGAFRHLCDEDMIEPLASTATATRLDTLSETPGLRAQIELGILSITRAFGKRPVGFWSPRLAHRAEATTVLLDSAIQYVVLRSNAATPTSLAGHRLAALTVDTLFDRYLSVESLSYSGDPWYLAPRHDFLTMAWQRRGIGGEMHVYDLYDAYRKAQEHAEHFANVLAANASTVPAQLVALDAQVIGASWFEGPTWLRALLALLAEHEQLTLKKPAALVHASRSASEPLRPPSRFAGHAPSGVPHALQAAEQRLAKLARHKIAATGDSERVLCQAARELLLAQASDEVPFRSHQHLVRCEQLCDLAEHPMLDDDDLTLLETLEEADNPFADLNFRMFAR